jgi:hypothetical protein
VAGSSWCLRSCFRSRPRGRECRLMLNKPLTTVPAAPAAPAAQSRTRLFR